jgi:hypothetical protein
MTQPARTPSVAAANCAAARSPPAASSCAAVGAQPKKSGSCGYTNWPIQM